MLRWTPDTSTRRRPSLPFVEEKRERYRFLLGDPSRRATATKRLNHSRDLDPRYVEWLPSNADIATLLKKSGCPNQVYIISYAS